MDPTESTRLRLAAQLLSGPPERSPEQVVARLLAVQAQDPRGARLAVRARTSGLTAADVDRALDDRRLVVSWLNRGTLHLVLAEDYWWLQQLTTPPLLRASGRRLGQLGFTPAAADAAVGEIERALEHEGALTRPQLRDRLGALGIPVDGQALVHLLFLASLRGLVVRGPMVGAEQAFVLVREWLGQGPQIEREDALGSLARRFLAGHGPASDRDLAKWAGLPLTDARRALAAATGALVRRDDGLADLRDRPPVADLPPPRLLGAFDPILHGWVSREPVLGSHAGVVTSNGVFRPIALVDGRAVATWRLVGGDVRLAPFDRIPAAAGRALETEADDVRRFLGR